MDGRDEQRRHQADQLLAAYRRFRRAQIALWGVGGSIAAVRAEYTAARAELAAAELRAELVLIAEPEPRRCCWR